MEAAENLWRAVRIVAIADIVMSLDNVIAIAASAEAAAMRVDVAHAAMIKATLIIFGLATSVPLIIAGSALLMTLLERFPDPGLGRRRAARLGRRRHHDQGQCPAERAFSATLIEQLHIWAAAAGAVFVVAVGYLMKMRRAGDGRSSGTCRPAPSARGAGSASARGARLVAR